MAFPSTFRSFCASAAIALLNLSSPSYAQKEIPLMVNSQPIEVYVSYPTKPGENSKLVDGVASFIVYVDMALKNYLIGHFPEQDFIPSFHGYRGSIKDNNIVLGTSALRHIYSLATALHRGDRIVTQSDTYRIDFYDLFLDDTKPNLLFRDEDSDVDSIFEGDVQIDPPFFVQSIMDPSDVHSLGLIVIRQKLYIKPATDDDAPATAVVEYKFLREKDDSVTPKEINIYRPKEQTSRGTRLRYLINGLTDVIAWGIHPDNSHLAHSQTNDHTWISPSTCDDSIPPSIDNTVTLGALSSTSPCTASAQPLMNPISSRLGPTPYIPPLTFDWAELSQFSRDSLDVVARSLLYAVRHAPGLRTMKAVGTATRSWVYSHMTGNSPQQNHFHQALIAFVVAGKEGKRKPKNVSPFTAALSRSSSKAAIDAEVRTRNSPYTFFSRVSHNNTAFIHFPPATGHTGKKN